MNFEINFGLPWKHPAVVLNGIALILDVLYEVMVTLVINVPAVQHPYHRLLLGWAAMYGMSLYCLYDSNSVFNAIVGYGMVTVNMIGSLVFTLTWIAYMLGPDSTLWNLMLR